MKGLSLLRQWQVLGLVLGTISSGPRQYEVDPAAVCTSLQHIDFLKFNTTILSALYYPNATEVKAMGMCSPTAHIDEPVCRVQFIVNTSAISSVTAEAWLPTSWSGRFLALGNGGLDGCIEYENLAYGSSLGFASVASNNGHDGNSGIAFANNSEVVADYTTRSIHVETLVGKKIAASFYERAPTRAYYMGCSTGGRQGMYAALHYPEDFDGILAGAPATNLNHLLGWSAIVSMNIGAPDSKSNASFIPPELWEVVAKEVLTQCDSLDGVRDNIISEPDACEFRPDELLCDGSSKERCLSEPQVAALRSIYSPLFGRNGELIFPRFDPGAESSPIVNIMFSGKPHPYAPDWYKYVVHNDADFDYSKMGLDDIALADELDPGKASTFNGDFSDFRARGGKLITYHGRADPLIPSGNAKTLYNLVSRTLGARSESLDEFYRLFLVPGMGHCYGGGGARFFGQHGQARVPSFSAPVQEEHQQDVLNSEDNKEQPTNVLLALVDWVERDSAPEEIVGVSDDGTITRRHCRYPMRSHWSSHLQRWVCEKY